MVKIFKQISKTDLSADTYNLSIQKTKNFIRRSYKISILKGVSSFNFTPLHFFQIIFK